MSKVFTDHLGNTFASKKEMSRYWNIDYHTFLGRLKRGESLEDALSIEVKQHNEVTDHLGNTYKSMQEMCRYWNVNAKTVKSRIKRGESVKDALTKKVDSHTKVEVTDHLGNVFSSIKDMCGYWNVNPATFRSRISRGETLKDALTGEGKTCITKEVTDHLGNVFVSKAEMCRYWKVNFSTFQGRLLHGDSLEEALTGEEKKKNKKEITDHMGNNYTSIEEMTREYGISSSALRCRLRNGWSLEDALTIQMKERTAKDPYSMENMMNCGLKAKIIMFNNYHDIVIQFEDGETNSCTLQQFELGNVGHPLLKSHPGRKGYYGPFTTKCYEADPDGNRLYICECHACNSHAIITTAQQMLDHIRREHPDLIVDGKIKHCGITNGLLGW